jgi:flagellar protein FlgJ
MNGYQGPTMEQIDATSKSFEASFVSQLLESMFSTTDCKESLGGSDAEETYQSMMVGEYGKVIAKTSNLGIADQVKREMLKMQEVKPS